MHCKENTQQNEKKISVIPIDMASLEHMKSVYQKSHLEIEAKATAYNRTVLPLKLESKTLYKIKLEGYFCTPEATPYFLIKDTINDKALFSCKIENQPYELIFLSGTDVDGAELRIYPSKPSETNGIKCTINNITIESN